MVVRLVTTCALVACAACHSVDRAKLDAFASAAEACIRHDEETARLMCERGALDQDASVRMVQERMGRSQELSDSMLSAASELDSTDPPQQVRDDVAETVRRVAAVGLSVASVTLSCDLGEPTEETPAAREDLVRAAAAARESLARLRAPR